MNCLSFNVNPFKIISSVYHHVLIEIKTSSLVLVEALFALNQLGEFYEGICKAVQHLSYSPRSHSVLSPISESILKDF